MDSPPLSGMSDAIRDVTALSHGLQDRFLGVISFAIQPEAALLRLMAEAAHRLHADISHGLRGLLRDEDRLYAVDSWEWLIVLPGLRSTAALPLAMLKLQRVFAGGEARVDGVRLLTTTACGSAQFPEDGEDAHHLIQSARIARLQAVREGKGTAVYERSMDQLDADLIALERELDDAFNGDGSGLQLALQPQVNTGNGHCYGVEALLRWRRRSGENMPPMVLLAAIERLGMRMRFNRWLFQTSCRTARMLMKQDIPAQLSINLCANDLLDPEVPPLLAQAMDVWALPAHAIQLEITETTMVEETDAVRLVLDELREMGIGLAIDDFGTGFSSMSYLRKLPVHEVKIDRSFVQHIDSSERDREIVRSIVDLGHRLGLRVVAEGVETRLAAKTLDELGCDCHQGYLYSPAMPLDDFVNWYRQYVVQRRAS